MSKEGRPPLRTLAAYAALMVPMQVAWGPLLSTIPALYATYGSVSLKQIGLAMMVLRLLDVVVDPLIGWLSDRTQTTWGRRKPWLVAGSALVLPGAWKLFDVSRTVGMGRFAVYTGVVYLGWSMVEITHTAWLGELREDEGGRAVLSGWRRAAMSAGTLFFLAVPLSPRFADAAMTPAVVSAARWILLVTLPLALLLMLVLLPSGGAERLPQPGLRASLKALAGSRAMRILCGSLGLTSTASGMGGACYFFYLNTYLGAGAAFGYIGLTTYVMEIVSGLLTPSLIARIGKRASLALSNASGVIALLGMAVIRPGPRANAAVMVLFSVSSLVDACGDVAVPVMTAAAAGEDERQTGSSKLGNYVASTVLSRKAGIALGGGIAYLLLGSFGFNPRGGNGARAMMGFDLTLFVVPCLLALAAAGVAMRFPEAE